MSDMTSIVQFPRGVFRRRERSEPAAPETTGDRLSDAEVELLRRTVERTHACVAVPIKAMPVRKRLAGKTAWDGLVEIFELAGHAKAIRAYAWFSSDEESPAARTIATVLHSPHISSAKRAVHLAVPESTAPEHATD